MALGQLQEDLVPSRTPGMSPSASPSLRERSWMSHLRVSLSSLESASSQKSIPRSLEFSWHRDSTRHSIHPIFLWDGIAQNPGMGGDSKADPTHDTPPTIPGCSKLHSDLEYFQGWGIQVDPLLHFQQLWAAPKGFHIPAFPRFLLALQDFRDHRGFLILPEFLSRKEISFCRCSWLHGPSQFLTFQQKPQCSWVYRSWMAPQSRKILKKF